MNMLEELNAAIRCVEENLRNEINLHEVARIACISQDSFLRFFSYMTGMTLSEYIRKRRLSLAAQEIRRSDERIIDIALKYGYDSADAFSRAFAKQHGVTPSAARKGGALRIYPPASFHIIIKGAKEMNFRLIDVNETVICGVSRAFDRDAFSSRESLRHTMWSEDYDDVPGQIAESRWNEPGSHAHDGVWYGLWRNNRYMIGREPAFVKDKNLETQSISFGRYAAFATECGGFAGDELPKLWSLIFDSWLPDSGYSLAGSDVIEIYHLRTDKIERKKTRYYEIWIPIAK